MPPENPRYGPDSIVVISGREAVRRRPAMYFGPLENAVNQMAFEILDMSVNAAFAGTCDRITVVLKRDGVVSIHDNSDGISTDIREPMGVSFLELFFTELFTCGRLNFPPQVSGGFHGVGQVAVNVTSEWMEVETSWAGYYWYQSFQRGEPKAPVARQRAIEGDGDKGVRITFKPDSTVLMSLPDVTEAMLEFDWDVISKRCQEIAYQVPRLTIVLRDERTQQTYEHVFHEPNGLRGLLDDLRPTDANPLHDPIHATLDLKTSPRAKHGFVYPFQAEIAIQFTDANLGIERGYCNSVETTHGGTHMDGLRSGIVAAVNSYLPLGTPPFRRSQLPAGLLTAVSVLNPMPQFWSGIVIKLMNEELRNPIKRAVEQTVKSFARQHPDQMQRIIEHCMQQRSRRN